MDPWQVVSRDDIDLWRESYRFIPPNADEDTIRGADPAALESAFGLMHGCHERPPPFGLLRLPWFSFTPELLSRQAIDAMIGEMCPAGVELAPITELQEALREGSTGAWGHALLFLLNEMMRYPRVCRELGRRVAMSDPERALGFLKLALIPADVLCPLRSLADLREHERLTLFPGSKGPRTFDDWQATVEINKFHLKKALEEEPAAKRLTDEDLEKIAAAMNAAICKGAHFEVLIGETLVALKQVDEPDDVGSRPEETRIDLQRLEALKEHYYWEGLVCIVAPLLAFQLFHVTRITWNAQVAGDMVAVLQHRGQQDEADRVCDSVVSDVLEYLHRVQQDDYEAVVELLLEDVVSSSAGLFAADILSRRIDERRSGSNATSTVERAIDRALERHLRTIKVSLGQIQSGVQKTVEISEETREIGKRTERKVDTVHDRLDGVMETLIELRLRWEQIQQAVGSLVPAYVQEAVARELAGRLGAVWHELGPDTRRCLVTARMLMAWCQNRENGWQYPVLGLCEAVERELQRTLGPLGAQRPLPANEASRRGLGEWVRWLRHFTESDPGHLWAASLRDLWPLLDEVRRLRNVAAHASRHRIAGKQARRLEAIVLGDGHDGLLARLVALRTGKG